VFSILWLWLFAFWVLIGQFISHFHRTHEQFGDFILSPFVALLSHKMTPSLLKHGGLYVCNSGFKRLNYLVRNCFN